MADFKNMKVQALRDLARKAIGRGHSKLKTNDGMVFVRGRQINF